MDSNSTVLAYVNIVISSLILLVLIVVSSQKEGAASGARLRHQSVFTHSPNSRVNAVEGYESPNYMAWQNAELENNFRKSMFENNCNKKVNCNDEYNDTVNLHHLNKRKSEVRNLSDMQLLTYQDVSSNSNNINMKGGGLQLEGMTKVPY